MWWLYNSRVCFFSEVNWGKQSGAGCLHPLSFPVLQIHCFPPSQPTRSATLKDFVVGDKAKP